MALLGDLLGTVDGLLGGATGALSGATTAVDEAGSLADVGALLETSPSVGLSTGLLGGVEASVSAPILVGVDAEVGKLDLGGLLGGLV